MKALIKRLYGLMRKVGHPVLWGALFVALYGNMHYRDRLYWETPSIPFRPFCTTENWEPSRPINGVTMTRKFEEQVVQAMATNKVTMKVIYRVSDEFGDRPNRGPHIFVAPIDYYRANRMRDVTRDALYSMPGHPAITGPDGKTKIPWGPAVRCKHIEGVISEL